MYKPPIELVMGNLQHLIEKNVCRAVAEIGIIVDKYELIKALEYDRGQYDKGYRDGIADFMKHYHGTIIKGYELDELVKEMTEEQE